MNRPVRVDRLQNPNLGLKTIEGTDPRDMALRCDQVFAAALASDPTAWLCGMSLGGGGGGAAWRVTLTLGDVLGAGPNGQASVYIGRAHVWFALARHFAELDAVTARLVDDITAAYPNAFVYDVQVAGGGRDGIYMVAVCFDEEANSPPLTESFNNSQTTIGGATDVVSVTLPQTPSGGPNDQVAFKVDWSIAVHDDTATSHVVGLYSDIAVAFVEEYEELATDVGDWPCYAGTYYVLQSVGIDTVMSIRVVPTGGNVDIRDAQIIAQMVPRGNAVS